MTQTTIAPQVRAMSQQQQQQQQQQHPLIAGINIIGVNSTSQNYTLLQFLLYLLLEN
ncbi:MAG TPA: hypothetical protein VJ729_13750 [Nitrososphaeraceae archaeon]|nr:hypothetical protein [Nitrososphaeraceae archaeon]